MKVVRMVSDFPAIHKSGEQILHWRLGKISPLPSHVPEGWELVRLTSVARLESGHTPARNQDTYWSGQIPWISLHDTSTLDGPQIFRTALTISEEGLANSSARLLPKGTVVFSRTATVGKCTVMGSEMTTSQDFANFVCSNRLNNFYLMHLFRFMTAEWKRVMAGSTHNTIYMPVFQSLEILIPPLSEQEAITEALNDADALIDSLEQLILKKGLIKKGAMRDLLTGKKRLPGFVKEWEVGTMADRFDLVGTRNAELNDNVLTISAHLGFVRQEEFFNKRVASSFLENYYLIKRGHFAYNRSYSNGYPFGAIKRLTKYEKGVVTTLYICFMLKPDTEADQCFFEQYFEAGLLNPNLSIVTNEGGRAHGLLNITKADFFNCEIRYPPQTEQTAIAKTLNDMDKEIEALKAKLTKARQIKQGMMQALLTGRIRLV